jgi:predicted GNAT family acetyltransferase
MGNLPSDAVSVRHNAAASRYEIELDGHLAVAEYELAADGAMTFTHTFVPPELRGRGLAEKLVRRALDDARDAKRRVVPACSYVATFIQRNREYQSLVR